MSRDRQEKYCQEVLKKIKPKIRAFVFDVDGTIKSSSEPECLPLELMKKIVSSGKFAAIITASGVSALEGLAQPIVKLISENNYSIPVYFGVANGVALYRLDNQGRHELYHYSLKIDEINNILEAWTIVMKKNKIKDADLVEKGLITFKEFLKKDWGGYIPEDYLLLSGKFAGKCFVEKLKATFVMPRNEVFSQEKFVATMQEEIDKIAGRGKYIIDMGDTTFSHVTQRPGMIPKLFALKRIIKELKLKKEQVLTFGDMPFGNDKGLLIDSHLPYTFTNKYFDKPNIKNPPFVLPESEQTPIKSVYKAVDFLLT